MKGLLPIIGPVLIFAFVGLMAYIRLAPSDPARWHVMPDQVQDETLPGGAMRVIPGDEERFAELAAIMEATPRTQHLAGTVEEGMVTYITRSLVFGFPDYTTARLQGDQIEIYSRLRFGQSDMGVNAARLESWLAQLGQE